MSGQRLRLTTSRPAGYRRGGQVIGGAAAPAFIGPGDVTPEQMLAILRDPNIAVAIETEDDVFRALTDEERAEIEERAEDAIEQAPAAGGESDTSGPQGGGGDPAVKADPAPAENAPTPAAPASKGTGKPSAVKAKS